MARPVNTAPCAFDGCDRPRRTRGLCITHYGQWLTGGRKDEALHEIRPVGICSGPDCTTPARDLCKVHQQQLTRRGGDRDLLTRSGERLKPQPVMCSGPGCDREGRTRGLCKTHLKQFRQRGDMALLTPIVTPTPKHSAPCPGPECDRMASVHGLCAAHYGQLRRRGDRSLLTPIGTEEAQARQDYTARELDVAVGERVRVDRELAGWLWVHNEAGQSGWIPASCIASPS